MLHFLPLCTAYAACKVNLSVSLVSIPLHPKSSTLGTNIHTHTNSHSLTHTHTYTHWASRVRVPIKYRDEDKVTWVLFILSPPYPAIEMNDQRQVRVHDHMRNHTRMRMDPDKRMQSKAAFLVSLTLTNGKKCPNHPEMCLLARVTDCL